MANAADWHEGLIDSHCHLVLLREQGRLDDALASCVDAGVRQVLSVGLDVEDSHNNREIAESRAGVFFSVGWHPHTPAVPDSRQMGELDELLTHPRAVAVGEVGLDLFFRPGYHETPVAIQTRALHAMFELAETHSKPVILHDREAHNEILAVMRQHPDVRGVMHCFSGDLDFAKRCIDAGYMVSFSGIVTFPKADNIAGAAAGVGNGDYLVETDAPFLAPVPHRGQTNLPGFVAETARKVATLRDAALDVVAQQSTANARHLFQLPDDDVIG